MIGTVIFYNHNIKQSAYFNKTVINYIIICQYFIIIIIIRRRDNLDQRPRNHTLAPIKHCTVSTTYC